jgi:hypothetical protein
MPLDHAARVKSHRIGHYRFPSFIYVTKRKCLLLLKTKKYIVNRNPVKTSKLRGKRRSPEKNVEIRKKIVEIRKNVKIREKTSKSGKKRRFKMLKAATRFPLGGFRESDWGKLKVES